MTTENARQIESLLENSGFRKYRSALTSSETFGYFKGFEYDSDNDPAYQIEFRFWDFRKYGGISPDEEFGVDVIVLITNGYHNVNLSWSADVYDVAEIESIAAEFYKFCIKNITKDE